MATMEVQLTGARCGHKYDGKNITKENPHGRFIGVFAQPANAIVTMEKDEAERYLERGLATLPKPDTKK